MTVKTTSICLRKGWLLALALLLLATVAQAADITDITCHQRKENLQHCDFLLDGEAWSHGSVPGDLTGQEILDWLEGQKNRMREDMARAERAAQN